LVQLPYTWKFLWSPLLDRFIPPLGRRRGWMLIAQVLVMLGMFSLSLFDPTQSVGTIARVSFLIALFSATQDIALDAYRRELLPESELGFGKASYGPAGRPLEARHSA
jgi:PAT family beta-lactamase induction signal transducer AmpG